MAFLDLITGVPTPCLDASDNSQFRRELTREGSKLYVMNITDPSVAAESPQTAHSAQAHTLLSEFADVFADIPPGLPPERGFGHTINTGNNPPVSQPMYRMSPKEKECAERMVSDMIEKGWIRPSRSPYSSPILFVQKPDGSLRLCVDYRALNNQTVKDRYPLPRIDDLLDRLLGACVFSSLDLQSGYHQIRIADSDVPKTAFITNCGLYEYQVLPFGLCNAPAAFQREMNRIFGRLEYVVCYIDDILVFSKTEAEHQIHLARVLTLLRENKYYAKLSKCSFFEAETKFLGHVVSAQGVHVNPEKIKVINDWPEPRTASELRSFLGLANFFRKFVMRFSTLALPLTKLSAQEHEFSFDDCARKAFQDIKNALIQAPVLAVPDPSKGYELVCDASGFGCGAVLLQGNRPVAFWSYKMSPAETRYHAGEQELLAVVKAMEHWRHYLEGAVSLSVVTDHKPNITLATKPSSQLSRRQVRWQQFMSRFDFEWEWRKGVHNMADPLSRNPALLNTLQPSGAPPSVTFLERIAPAYAQDPYFSDELKTRKFVFDGQYWRRDSRIIVPNFDDLRKECIAMHHDAVYSGHLGKDRTIDLIVRNYWWPNIHADVTSYVQRCDICQRTKVPSQKPAGLLQPLAIPHEQWESISVDFITQLPETLRGNSAIVTFVDRLTKMVHLAPTTTSVGGKDFADIFIRDIFSKHGLPKSIVSDRDPRFTSDFSTEFTRQLGIEQHLSTAFHPQTDGQTERMNRYVETILRGFVNPTQDDWDTLLPLVEFVIHNSSPASIQITQFFLNYGRHPRTPANIDVPVRGPPLPSRALEIQAALTHAKACLKDAQHHMSRYANQKRRDVSYEIGDFVLLHSKNLRLKFDGSKKLMHRYFGPFEILKKFGPAAYELKIPASMQMHDVFHVSLLKLYKRRGDQLTVPPPALLPDGGTEFEVESIVGHRFANSVTQFLVHWRGADSDSWLDESELSNCKDLLSEYCLKNGIKLSVSKQQSRKSKKRAASRKPLPRPRKRAHT